MKKLVLILMLTAYSTIASACPFCNKKIMEGIYNTQFLPNLLTMLSAFIALAVVVAALSALSTKRYRRSIAANPAIGTLSPVPLTTASIVLGIGLGGFIDGIVLHQVLQVHEMLSNNVPTTDYIGKSVNMFWDGVFHFFCLVVVVVGIVLLWKLLQRKDIDRSGKLLSGGLLVGWGLFNIIEGVIDHHLLMLHNVIELSENHAVGNYTFLGISVLMLIGGYGLINSKRGTTSNRQVF